MNEPLDGYVPGFDGEGPQAAMLRLILRRLQEINLHILGAGDSDMDEELARMSQKDIDALLKEPEETP